MNNTLDDWDDWFLTLEMLVLNKLLVFVTKDGDTMLTAVIDHVGHSGPVVEFYADNQDVARALYKRFHQE